MKKSSLLVGFVVFIGILMFVVPEAIAQTPPPPALPGMPDQAPLGGLALLAAAGGAYAWRKLRGT
jgi:hypothetical protein